MIRTKKAKGLAMLAEQISVFVENRTGRLGEILELLAENKINIRALSMADTSDFGVLRLIACDQAKAWNVLTDAGFTLGRTRVVAVELPDHPGALAAILKIVSAYGINVEYMYACARRDQNSAIMIFRFDRVDDALQALAAAGYTLIGSDQLCAI